MTDLRICEVCGQRKADHSVVRAEVGGSTSTIHLCSTCAKNDGDGHLADVEKMLRNGRCQFCGEPAKIVDGIPPNRLIMCYECAGQRYK